jgi:hypothetical protein
MKLQKMFNQSSILSVLFTAITLIGYPSNYYRALAKSEYETCKPIKTIARTLEKQNSKASLTLKKTPVSQYYTSAPQGFLLDITTINSQIGTTSELSYSKQIIRQCHGVIAVRFSQSGSDWGYVYGLVNSRVRRFECPQGKNPGNRPFKWGNECLA